MPEPPVHEFTSSLVSRIVIDLDTIRHSLGRSGGQTESAVNSARCQIAALRVMVVRACEAELQGRLLDLLDRVECQLGSRDTA